MAIYYVKISNITRQNGSSVSGKQRSAVACAAYRAGEKLYDEENGKFHSYTNKSEVRYSEIFLPANAPDRFRDRQSLWNSVQEIENKSDSRLAREFVVAIPNEFSEEKSIAVLQEFCEQLSDEGMCADVSFHNKKGNLHGHIMATTREIEPDGSWKKCKEAKANVVLASEILEYDVEGKLTQKAKKHNEQLREKYDGNPFFVYSRSEKVHELRMPIWDDVQYHLFCREYENRYGKEFDLQEFDRRNFEKDEYENLCGRLKSCQYTYRRPDGYNERKWERVYVAKNKFNKSENIERWREMWAEICNKYLDQEHQINHLSYERQEKDKIAQIHEGYAAREMEKRGEVSDRCEYNRKVDQTNAIGENYGKLEKLLGESAESIRSNIEFIGREDDRDDKSAEIEIGRVGSDQQELTTGKSNLDGISAAIDLARRQGRIAANDQGARADDYGFEKSNQGAEKANSGTGKGKPNADRFAEKIRQRKRGAFGRKLEMDGFDSTIKRRERQNVTTNRRYGFAKIIAEIRSIVGTVDGVEGLLRKAKRIKRIGSRIADQLRQDGVIRVEPGINTSEEIKRENEHIEYMEPAFEELDPGAVINEEEIPANELPAYKNEPEPPKKKPDRGLSR